MVDLCIDIIEKILRMANIECSTCYREYGYKDMTFYVATNNRVYCSKACYEHT